MDSQHPLYYQCTYNPNWDRYGLLRSKDNSFYIIDNNMNLLKDVQLMIMKYEVLHLVNVDHYFNFLSKTGETVKRLNIQELTEHHNNHVSNAAIFHNDSDRIEKIQKNINNDNCHLFGITKSSSWSLFLDVNHFRLEDNIIEHNKKDVMFDNDVQEKVFLLRKILYTIQGTFEYINQFVSLQEDISVAGLKRYKTFFSMCYPEDTVFSKLADADIEACNTRLESIKHLQAHFYRSLNSINLNNSILKIIQEYLSIIGGDQTFIVEIEKLFPAFERTYDIHRAQTIIVSELNKLLTYYNYD